MRRCFEFFEQCFDRTFAAVFTALLQHGLSLLGSRCFNVPSQHAAVKRVKHLAALGAGPQQQHDAYVRARKVLHQTRQQLDFVVSQSASVMHDPDSGRRVKARQLHGLLHRLCCQHVIETRQHGRRVSRKINLQRTQR